jgi:hypothetical protein
MLALDDDESIVLQIGRVADYVTVVHIDEKLKVREIEINVVNERHECMVIRRRPRCPITDEICQKENVIPQEE